MHTSFRNQNGGNDAKEKNVGADGRNTCASEDKISLDVDNTIKIYKDFCRMINSIRLDDKTTAAGLLEKKRLVAEEILKTLTVLNPTNEVIETRIKMKNGGIRFGYFCYMDELAKALSHEDHRNDVAAIYITLNPVDPALLARCKNRIQDANKDTKTTSDDDILRRRWLPIDLDPTRKALISSTNEEFEYSIERMYAVNKYLTSLGWAEAVLGVSGNGTGLLYPIDLPTKDNLVERVNKALCKKFNDEQKYQQ